MKNDRRFEPKQTCDLPISKDFGHIGYSSYLSGKIGQTSFAVVDARRDLKVRGYRVVLRCSSSPLFRASCTISPEGWTSRPTRCPLGILGRRRFAGILHGGNRSQAGLGRSIGLLRGRDTLVLQHFSRRGQQRIDIGSSHLPR